MKNLFLLIFIFLSIQFDICLSADGLMFYQRKYPPNGFGYLENLFGDITIMKKNELSIDFLRTGAELFGIEGYSDGKKIFIVAYGEFRLVGGANYTNNIIIFSQNDWKIVDQNILSTNFDSITFLPGGRMFITGKIDKINNKIANNFIECNLDGDCNVPSNSNDGLIGYRTLFSKSFNDVDRIYYTYEYHFKGKGYLALSYFDDSKKKKFQFQFFFPILFFSFVVLNRFKVLDITHQCSL